MKEFVKAIYNTKQYKNISMKCLLLETILLWFLKNIYIYIYILDFSNNMFNIL